MLVEQSEVRSLLADLVYAKTEKGRAEVARRSAGLSARQRSILIMLDGQKGAHALTALVPPVQLNAVLDELAALGLVAPVQGQAVGPERSLVDLAPVKSLMIRSAETYLGPIASELIRQIDDAADAGQLQRAVGHWHMAMQASKYGKEVATEHLALVKAGLQAGSLTPV